MKKKGKVDILIIVFLGLIVIGGIVVAGALLPDLNSAEPSIDLECFIEIKNTPFFEPGFGEIDCTTKPSSLFSLYSILPDFLEEKGTVKMIVQGKTASKRYEVTEGTTKTVSLVLKKLEQKSSTGEFILYGDAGQVYDRREVFIT
jgi:hypothetical protein